MNSMIVKDRTIVGYDGDPKTVKDLVIPATAEAMSDEFRTILFKRMNSLEKVTVEKGNKSFSSRNGVLYDRTMSTLIYYPRAKRRSAYRMPDTIREIGPMAFTDSRHSAPMLEDVMLSASLSEIPDNCFRNAAVYTVTIPEGITRIGRYAFAGSNIVCPTMPASLRHLSTTAFRRCRRMHLLNIREDNFGLRKSMLPDNDRVYVIFETTEEIIRSKYEGIDVMNLVELDRWLENDLIQ